MVKKVFIVLTVIILVSVMSTVGLADDDGGWLSNLLDSKDDDLTVGLLLKTMQEERYEVDKAAFTEKAEELGAEVIFESANNDEDTQLDKFENMLTKGVDAIAIQPIDPVAAGNMVKRAQEAGVPVIAYDMLITGDNPDVFVTPDAWKVGEFQGEAMVEWFKEQKGEVEGNIVLLRGDPGCSNSPIFTQGVLDTVEEHSGLEIVVDQTHDNYSPDEAMKTTEDALTRFDNDIDAVVANNSGMASGAVRALEEQGLADTDKVFVAGSDADLTNVRYIEQGKQVMDVYKEIEPLAHKAAEVAVELAENSDKEAEDIIEIDKKVDNGKSDIPAVLTPIAKVNKDTIIETVVEGGYHSEEDIFEE